MRTIIKKPRRGAKSTALLSAAVLAASGIVATMGVANAAVTRGGGENAAGTPGFYRDAQGVALELCTDANEVRCEPAVDDHVGVYFAASAAAGPLNAGYAVEAINDPVDGLLVFNATRYRLEGARPNARYLIKDPWGTLPCRTDATGGADCKFESDGEFGTVRNGHIKTFLRALGRNGSAFIGNADLTSRVLGSPTGFNKVRVTAPGGRSWTTSQFSLMGQKRADTAMSAVNKRSLEMGNGRTADAVTRAIRYTSFGTAAARPTVRKGGLNPGAFSVRNQCASQAPGSSCQILVTFAPRQHANSVKRAFLTIDDNGLAAPRRVSLKGVGVRR